MNLPEQNKAPNNSEIKKNDDGIAPKDVDILALTKLFIDGSAPEDVNWLVLIKDLAKHGPIIHDNMEANYALDFTKWILTQDEKNIKSSCEYLMKQNPEMDVLREALEEAAKNPLYPGKTWTDVELAYLIGSLLAHDTPHVKVLLSGKRKLEILSGYRINEKDFDLDFVFKRDNNFIPRIIAIENAKITPQPIAIEAAEPGFVEKIIDKLREARNYYKQPGESTSPSKKPKPP